DRKRAYYHSRHARLDDRFDVFYASNAAAELHRNVDSANDLLESLPIARVGLRKGAVQINHVKHRRARLRKALCDGNRITVVDRRCVLASLCEPDALAIAEINCGNNQHHSPPRLDLRAISSSRTSFSVTLRSTRSTIR